MLMSPLILESSSAPSAEVSWPGNAPASAAHLAVGSQLRQLLAAAVWRAAAAHDHAPPKTTLPQQKAAAPAAAAPSARSWLKKPPCIKHIYIRHSTVFRAHELPHRIMLYYPGFVTEHVRLVMVLLLTETRLLTLTVHFPDSMSSTIVTQIIIVVSISSLLPSLLRRVIFFFNV